MFLEVVEEDADHSIVEAALKVGKVPHIKEGTGVKMMVGSLCPITRIQKLFFAQPTSKLIVAISAVYIYRN